MACFLKRLATGASFFSLGCEFCMCESYATTETARVAKLFLKNFAAEMRAPTRADAEASAHVFKERFGFEGCSFAIDGTHIRFRYVS